MQAFDFLTRRPFAHRGLHIDVPENSLSAFRAAVEHGYGIETDVRLSSDGRLVIFHDDDLFRMTGDPRAVEECSVPELKHLRLEGTAEQIPLLSEALKLVGGRVPLLIEIKKMDGVKPKKIAAALHKVLEHYDGEFAVQSFQPFYVKAFKKLRPDVPCGILGTAEKGAAKGFKMFTIKSMPFNCIVKPDFISYRREDFMRRRVLKFKKTKLVWVVHSEKEEDAIRKYADNLIFEDYLPQ